MPHHREQLVLLRALHDAMVVRQRLRRVAALRVRLARAELRSLTAPGVVLPKR